MAQPFYIDRSGMETYQRCHRKYWWERGYGGRGIVRKRRNLALAVGTVIHTGLEALILGKGVETAIDLTEAEFERIAATSGIEVAMTDDEFFVVEEQKALMEGMLRAFDYTTLPKILEEYEILETETEEVIALTPEISWMARPDAVMRHRKDGDLYVLSFKTAATWDARKDRAAMTDVQGLSEAYPVEKRYREKVMGIQMVHLLKGSRYQDKTTLQYYQSSPLIRGYQRYGPGGVEYAHSYEWTDPTDGKKHRLGGKWEKMYVPAQYPGGVKAWIDHLAHQLIQPEAGSGIDDQVVMPVPYARQEEDMTNWQEQTIAESSRLEIGLRMVADDSSLNSFFPQYRHSCNYPSDCAFIDLCYGAKSIREAPLENGYEWRRANHPIEETVLPKVEA